MSERRIEKMNGLRLEPLMDLGQLLVFTPEHPKIHWLNAKAWLIFELCEDASEEEILLEYASACSSAEEREASRGELRAGIDELLRRGIVREVHSPHLVSQSSFKESAI